MKSIALAVVMLSSVVAGPALAQNSDDVKWIGQCVSDNKDEGQTPAVVTVYCTCMNDKMSSSENRSITQFEKANPKTQEACSKEAKWTSK
ncbi:MAG: hypothetical protein JWN71_1795 [Xanthobacteraceae bacterium]|jgi:hypothetical protein|nr:hypothetical protein [Xanthobacteraceae bacterium]